MKRFSITNPDNGLQFTIEAEVLGPAQPEWGANYTVVETDLDAAIQAKLDRINTLRSKVIAYRDFDIANATTAQLKTMLAGQREILLKVIQMLKRALEDGE